MGAGGHGSRGGTRGGRPETIEEGGGRWEQEAMEVGEAPEVGGPRQYRRAEERGGAEGCTRGE
jgi:hypothetical protein